MRKTLTLPDKPKEKREMSITVSSLIVRKVQDLEALYAGKNGDFTRIEQAIDRMRSHICDMLISEVRNEIHKKIDIRVKPKGKLVIS